MSFLKLRLFAYICDMIRFRAYLIGLVISLLFIGNVGVDVYKHICKEDGVAVSYLINTIDHCDDKHQHEKPCCQEEEKQNNCCDDEMSYFQIKLDFFESYAPSIYHFNGHIPVDLAWCEPAITLNTKWHNVDYTDPPPLSNSERQSYLQLYII